MNQQPFKVRDIVLTPRALWFPDVFCSHLIHGYPEVTTNVTFIQNNTGPFENRTQHNVRLDRCGDVIRSHAAGDVVG